jgi:hypothetical protein
MDPGDFALEKTMVDEYFKNNSLNTKPNNSL